MPSLPTRHTARLATGAVLTALTLPLAACNLGSDNVSCSGTSCTATLSGDGAEVSILGTRLAFGGVKDGRATVSVGSASASCAQGESVSVGPLSLTCTTVSQNSVQITAGAG